MRRTSPDPFSSHGQPSQVACINNWMQFSELANHYIRSADALVVAALERSMLLDVHVQPACFLYRHGLELLLKDLAWKSLYLATGTKRFAEKNWKELGLHGLSKIWDGAKTSAETVLGAGFPLNSETVAGIRAFLIRVEIHDPGSYSFRYPIIKKGGRAHPQLTNVQSRNAPCRSA